MEKYERQKRVDRLSVKQSELLAGVLSSIFQLRIAKFDLQCPVLIEEHRRMCVVRRSYARGNAVEEETPGTVESRRQSSQTTD